MSWLANRRIRKMTDPADGTLAITATSAVPTLGERAQSFLFTGVVQAPDLPPTAVQVTGLLAPADKWPHPGATLPVVVDRAHPQDLVIRWDKVPTAQSIAWSQATVDAFRQRTGVDAAVLEQAIEQIDGTAEAGYDAPVPAPIAAPATGPVVAGPAVAATPMTGSPVGGTVVAVQEVRLPPGLAPDGGVCDLTIRLDATGATAVARARFETVADRAQRARPGAPVQVLMHAGNPGLVTLVT